MSIEKEKNSKRDLTSYTKERDPHTPTGSVRSPLGENIPFKGSICRKSKIDTGQNNLDREKKLWYTVIPVGIWCNGNTRDFDSRFVGSSPAIPATNKAGADAPALLGD